jgi:hypothetical protein
MDMKNPEVRSNARNAFERRRGCTQSLRTKPALAVFCGRPCAVRSTVDNRHVRTHAMRSNAGPFSGAYK